MNIQCEYCNHFHMNRKLRYNTDYHGFVQTPPICGYNISNETICFCEERN